MSPWARRYNCRRLCRKAPPLTRARRRRGYATSALRCLLAHSHCLLLRAEVAQWPGAVAAVRSLTRLGFQQAAGCDLPGYILYQRPQNVHSGENMQDVL
mmetsp:Transcript_107831/g.347960  ORF Transcript_107831/g.347960 Transcript_107831/m.347960 type:complete len:99 (-) Transcript_107831:170-466(-)